MSVRRTGKLPARANVFAALGDETRLSMLSKLGSRQRYSISQLTEGTQLIRQAVTKHLRVLERARVVHAHRKGRERLFELDPQPLDEATRYLESVSKQWDAALARLKAFVEN